MTVQPATPRVAPITSRGALIGLDWGTSSLRAYLFDASGELLDRREAALGITQISDAAFRQAFESFCADWLNAEPRLPVLACGMIGSRQGWREAPYLPCPASLSDLGNALCVLDDLAERRFLIVPGLRSAEAATAADVLRGEETQIFGLVPERASQTPALRHVVLPGSHSKWVVTREDTVLGFESYLTGELYAAVSAHTIVGRLFPPGESDFVLESFVDGLQAIRARGDALTHLLFTVRAQALLGVRAAAHLPSYLSGLLIGAELNSALPAVTAGHPVLIVGSDVLSERYRIAIETFGRTCLPARPDAAVSGLRRLARQAGLLSA